MNEAISVNDAIFYGFCLLKASHWSIPEHIELKFTTYMHIWLFA